MTPSIVVSVFFAFSFLAFISGFYLVKKAETALNGFIWLPVSWISVLCSNALWVALIHLCRIPVNILSVGIFDLAAAAVLWFFILFKKKRQAYQFDLFSALGFGVVLLLVAFLAWKQFGAGVWIHYITSDPSVHFCFAMDIVNQQAVEGMFFAQLNNALFIETFSPFVSAFNYYKLFILSDVFMFVLSGWMFFAMIRRYCKTLFLQFAGIGITVVYLLGYPLNNMVFGFVYLGVGVTLISFILYLTDVFLAGQLERKWNIYLLMTGSLAIFLCYSLFMPAVYVSAFLAVAVAFLRRRQLFTIKGIGTLLAIYLIPVILGLVYAFFGFFDTSTPQSAIANEGFIYRDLFSNFIIFLPFALYGVIMQIKRKEVQNTAVYFFGVFAVYIFGLFALGMFGKASSYYFYKNYYVMWMLVFDLLMYGLYRLSEKSKELVISYLLVWVFVAGMSFGRLDDKIHQRNINFNLSVKSSAYLDIFWFNKDALNSARMDPVALTLYRYAAENCVNGAQPVPLAGAWDDMYWYEGLSNQRLEDYYYWQEGEDVFLEKLQMECGYVTVLKDSELYEKHQAYFDGLERVYENTAGFVAKVK